jgi:hypothetical protein
MGSNTGFIECYAIVYEILLYWMQYNNAFVKQQFIRSEHEEKY